MQIFATVPVGGLAGRGLAPVSRYLLVSIGRMRLSLDRSYRAEVFLMWISTGLALVLAVGWLDYLTGPELSFSIFYLVPIAIATWKGGLRTGFAASVLSAVVWYAAEATLDVPYSSQFIPYWNALIRLGFFLIVVALLWSLKCSRERLTVKEKERTSQLTFKIEEHKLDEAQLKLQSAALDAAAVGIVIAERDGTVLWVNPAFSALTGYEPGEVVGKNLRILKSGKHDREFYRNLWETILSGRVWNGEVTNRRKDGGLYPEEMTITPVRSAEGEITHFIAIKRDITDRKEAEDRIRDQAALLDVATDAIIVRDMEDRILFWNQGAVRQYGWSREEALGKKAYELLYREVPPQVGEAKRILLERGEWRGELAQVTKDGRDIFVECRWSLVRDNAGNPKSTFIVNSDVTEKRKFEAQYYRAQRMESIGTLAGGIAHDLNNVLAPILMSVLILKEKFQDEQGRRVVSTIEASALRGSDIVRQVLTFARGTEGQRVLFESSHLIQEIHKIIAETFPKSIEIRSRVAKDLWKVLADPTQIQQVLMNLCVNARDAMPNGGKLTIEAENVRLDEQYARMNMQAKAGPFVMVAVSDTGTGMSREVREKVFEPFFTTKPMGKGTGLGLATVAALVKSHGGFVNVYSEVGKGTTFKVYLPAAEGEPESEPQVGTSGLITGNGELVLVVDDEESIRDITKDTLEACGYRVMTAKDGTEAVAVYAEHRGDIAVVVTDTIMPYMEGPAVIRALRKMNPTVKIIAMSGAASNFKLGGGGVEGADRFLRKPFTAGELLKMLHEVLSRA